MGQTLSEPVTEKHTTVITRDKKFWVGLSDMQGWRISMEDSHSVHLHLSPNTTSSSSDEDDSSSEELPAQPAGSTVSNRHIGKDGPAFFGVFDGHGGSTVAKFAGTTLHERLSGMPAYKNGDYAGAVREAYFKTDEDLRAEPSFFNDPSGCTAVSAIIPEDGKTIICANAGDSRCVLGWKGEAKAMSNDHKPTNKDETARISAAGGFVEFGRVNGNLALSRAMGDFEFKQNFSLDADKQIVSVEPEIITHDVDGEEEFLVLACDGIWDCLSSQQVVDFTRRAIANGDELGKICEDMMVKCLAKDSETGGIGCDNMTVVIVALLGGRTIDQWRDWVKDRVEKKIGHDTPETIPDVFAQAAQQSSLTGISGMAPGGFRVTGAGGLANIASILGASGLSFRQVNDYGNEEGEGDGENHGGILVYDDDDEEGTEGGAKLESMDSEGSETKAEKGSEGEGLPDGYMDDKALRSDLKPHDVTDELPSILPDKVTDADAKRGSVQLLDEDGDSTMESDEESDSTTTGALTPGAGAGVAAASSSSSSTRPASSSTTSAEPLPVPQPNDSAQPLGRGPSFRSIGSPEIPTHQELQPLDSAALEPQDQLKSDPGGDAISDAVKVEGMMDTSESPLKL